jgi:hypothetical protein
MFGYCHNDECRYDIWGPTWHPETLTHHHHIENRAFSPFAKHTQEIEDIIETILANAYNGNMSFDIELDDCFSDEDLEYIKTEVQRRFV